ncbi:hypothetical protein [Streptomyces sp. cg35]|uniref:hypothetical protein n=1 Tax=Streptomyces sp. cg35 TaxID=3421650 RepID=UPI003D16C157
MESRLQQKLRERREQAALKTVEVRLGDLRTGGALRPGEEPAWARAAIDVSRGLHAEPDELISDDTTSQELDGWIEELLTAHGITGRLYVASNVSLLPWLECRVPPGGWTARVRAAVGEPWMFLSGTLDSLVVVSEAEYYFEAYARRR